MRSIPAYIYLLVMALFAGLIYWSEITTEKDFPELVFLGKDSTFVLHDFRDYDGVHWNRVFNFLQEAPGKTMSFTSKNFPYTFSCTFQDNTCIMFTVSIPESQADGIRKMLEHRYFPIGNNMWENEYLRAFVKKDGDFFHVYTTLR